MELRAIAIGCARKRKTLCAEQIYRSAGKARRDGTDGVLISVRQRCKAEVSSVVGESESRGPIAVCRFEHAMRWIRKRCETLAPLNTCSNSTFGPDKLSEQHICLIR